MKKVKVYDGDDLIDTIECETAEECDKQIAVSMRFGYCVEVEDEDGKVWSPI